MEHSLIAREKIRRLVGPSTQVVSDQPENNLKTTYPSEL